MRSKAADNTTSLSMAALLGLMSKMPIVVSHRAKRTFYVKSEEILGEVLGYSNFDGEDWAVGDVIVLEDGTSATIEKEEQFHVWAEPRPIQLNDALAMIQRYGDSRLPPGDEIDSFSMIFEKLSVPLPKKSWWRRIFPR